MSVLLLQSARSGAHLLSLQPLAFPANHLAALTDMNSLSFMDACSRMSCHGQSIVQQTHSPTSPMIEEYAASVP